MNNYKVNYDIINQFQTSKVLPEGSVTAIKEFEETDEQGQRTNFLDQNQNCEQILRILFAIVDKVNSDEGILRYALALINGIIEDRRTRIKRFVAI